MDDATNALLDAIRTHNPWWDRGTAAFDLPPRQKSDFYHLVRPDEAGAQFTDKRVLALVGRRGVGKTTLVHQFVHHEIATGSAVPEQFCYLPFDDNPLYQLKSDEQLRRAIRYYDSRIHGRVADADVDASANVNGHAEADADVNASANVNADADGGADGDADVDAVPQYIVLDDVHRIEHRSKASIDGWGTVVADLLDERDDRYVAVTASAAVQVDRELERAGVAADRYDVQPILPEKFRDYLYTREPALERGSRRVSPTSLRTGDGSLPQALATGDPDPFVTELRAKHDQVADVAGRIRSHLGQYLALGGVVSYALDETEPGGGGTQSRTGDDAAFRRRVGRAGESDRGPEPGTRSSSPAPAPSSQSSPPPTLDEFSDARRSDARRSDAQRSDARSDPIESPTVAVDAFARLRDDVRHALYQEVPGFESIQTIADLERLCALAAANRGADPLRFQRLVELFDVDRRTLTESYLPALEQLYLLTAATEYDNSRPRSVRLYLRDTGLVTALAGIDPDRVRDDLALEADYAHLAGYDHTARLAYGVNALNDTLDGSTALSVQYWTRAGSSVEYVFEVDGQPVPVGLAYRPGEEAATVDAVDAFCDAFDAPLGLAVTGDAAWAGDPVAQVGDRVVTIPYWLYLLVC